MISTVRIPHPMEKRDRIYAISLFAFSLFRRFFSLGMMNSKFSLISDFVCSLSGTAILFRGNVLISWAADSPPKRYFIFVVTITPPAI